ncbi:hypothetical protein BV898_09062 [Hypsibius exemplaris]|uniref:Uncharacterized protein n=1 Tax=Hypsibius exemplaris TaxID=2072580 RepID=A0A1W0WNU9_HYPEX|nr:hypothetical protein BV898_09062 [Hypsibius exemplaris]
MSSLDDKRDSDMESESETPLAEASSASQQPTGELVYLKCSCCDQLVEHRCTSADKAKTGEEALASMPVKQTTPRKRTRARRGTGKGFTGQKRRKTHQSPSMSMPMTALPSHHRQNESAVATTSDDHSHIGSFLGGDGTVESNGASATKRTRAPRIAKTAEDYWKQIGSEDLEVTEDGLDIFCGKCQRPLSKVSMGQRIRVDNLRTHLASQSHRRGPQEPEEKLSEIKIERSDGDDEEEEELDVPPLDTSVEELLETPPEDVTETAAAVDDVDAVDGTVTKSGRKKKSLGMANGGAKVTKTAIDYIEQFQCPELELATDNINIYCLACDRAITKVDQGQRIRVDNITSHIRSSQHKKLAEKRNSDLWGNGEEGNNGNDRGSVSGSAGGGRRSGSRGDAEDDDEDALDTSHASSKGHKRSVKFAGHDGGSEDERVELNGSSSAADNGSAEDGGKRSKRKSRVPQSLPSAAIS